MPNRRDMVTLGVSAAAAALVRAPGASAAAPTSRLETRLFNLKDGVSPDQPAEMIGALKDLAKSSGFEFMVGRNLSDTPFATRFEWISMIQYDPAAAELDDPAYQRFRRLQEALAALCRNTVGCDLSGPWGAGFAHPADVKVRHTVMFDFKPDATVEARERNVAAIRNMGTLPMVQHYVVQKNASPAPGATQMEWQVIGDFASLADFQAYYVAPVHLAIREDFTAHTARVAFLDVECAKAV